MIHKKYVIEKNEEVFNVNNTKRRIKYQKYKNARIKQIESV